MKSPCYTQLSNEFIESMHKYEGYVVKVFIAISRKTIGWHKISDRISQSQLKTLTGLAVNTIKKSIDILVKDSWITQTETKFGYSYDLNIDEEVSQDDRGVSHGDGALSCGDSTKKTNVKETSKKEKKEQYAPSVNMTEAQYVTLIYDYGHSITAEAVEKLSIYKQAKGKKYTSDYHAILNWVIDEVAGKKREEIKALRNAEREKRKGQRETMRLIDTDKLEQRLTPAETKSLIKDISDKMPTV